MKKIALIIENDAFVHPVVQGFVKDNPELFNTINTVTYADKRKEDIGTAIAAGSNCIVTSSTFLNKDQLEETVALFDSMPIKFEFYVDQIVDQLNKFISTSSGSASTWLFRDYEKFTSTIKRWAKDGLIFAIEKDRKAEEKIIDRFHGIYGKDCEDLERRPWKYSLIGYSEKYDMFYLDEEGEDSCKEELRFIHK